MENSCLLLVHAACEPNFSAARHELEHICFALVIAHLLILSHCIMISQVHHHFEYRHRHEIGTPTLVFLLAFWYFLLKVFGFVTVHPNLPGRRIAIGFASGMLALLYPYTLHALCLTPTALVSTLPAGVGLGERPSSYTVPHSS